MDRGIQERILHEEFSVMERSRQQQKSSTWLNYAIVRRRKLLSRHCPGVSKRCWCIMKSRQARCTRIARFGSIETRSQSIRSGVALQIDEGKSVTNRKLLSYPIAE